MTAERRDAGGGGARPNSLAYLTSNLVLSVSLSLSPLPAIFLFLRLYPTIIPFLVLTREELPGGDSKIEIVATNTRAIRSVWRNGLPTRAL